MDTLGLSIQIGAVDKASSILSGIINKISGGNGLVKALTSVGLAAAGIAIGLGVQAVKAASDFQSGITSLSTGAGELQSNLGMVSQGILDMAGPVGTSTDQLISGMYMIESAGFHGAAGLDILKAAAEGAKVGSADLGTVANGVTTIMTDYAAKHVTAAQATNMLIATVAAGKTHMQDLASALSTIAPTAAAVGVNVTDMNAALATMTGEGTDAASAATYLRQLLMALESPAKAGATTLKEIGLTTQQVAAEMKVSLPDTLQLITDHLAKKFPVGSAEYVAALKNIAGGSKQMQGILELTGTHLQTFKGNMTGISDAVTTGGKNITGFNQVQNDFNFKMQQAQASLQVLGITVGNALLPPLTSLMNNVIPLIGQFETWLQKSGALHDITQTLSTVIGDLGSVIRNPILPIVSDLWNGFMTVTHWFQQAGPQGTILKGVLLGIGGAIAGVKVGGMISDFMTFANSTAKTVQGAINNIIGNGTSGLKGIQSASQDACNDIDCMGSSIKTSESEIAAAAPGIASDLMSALGPLFAVEAIFGPAISGYINNTKAPGVNAGQTIFPGVGPAGTKYPWQPGGAWNPGGGSTSGNTNGGVPPNPYGIGPDPYYHSTPYAPRVRGGYAMGGPVTTSGWYNFNEMGYESVVPPNMAYLPQGTQVIPANGGSYGSTYISVGPITITGVSGDPTQISSQFVDALEAALARKFRQQTAGFALGGLP